MPMMCAKHHFGYVLEVHAYLVVTLKEVKLRETFGATELIQKLVNGGNWKAITNGNGIRGTVVDKKPP